jgi:hypothetical protein
MDGTESSKRRIGAAAKRRFVAALRQGARVRRAAAEAGFATSSLYSARLRDPVFAARWAEALADSGDPVLIAPHNNRRLQRRRSRALRFTPARRQEFLSYFAGSCDLAEAARSAGVTTDTVRRHRLGDPGFAAEYAAALEQGYRALEEELLRGRLEAQRKAKAGILPAGEPEAEFERGLKLLTRWERRDGRIGPAEYARSKRARWTFEDAIEALDKKLRALGARSGQTGAE